MARKKKYSKKGGVAVFDLGETTVPTVEPDPPPIIYDPVPPSDPQPVSPAHTRSAAPHARFHKIRLLMSTSVYQFDSSSPLQFLYIPYVEVLAADDLTLGQPDGCLVQEFQTQDVDNPGNGLQYHTMLAIIQISNNVIYRYRATARFRNHHGAPDEPGRAFDGTKFRPGSQNLQVVRPSGQLVHYVWRRLNAGVDPANDPNVFFQKT
jgi:hypothetical protein